MAKVFLRKKISTRIAEGHPWIFHNEIGDIQGSFSAGDILDIYSYNGSFVGKGFFNPHSKIRVRLCSRRNENIDQRWIKEKIQDAWSYRQQLGKSVNVRVVFAESDFLPGLIIDKYDDVLVFQTHCLGMDILKEWIIESIVQIFNTRKIYERNDHHVRLLENLDLKKGFVFEPFPTTVSFQNQWIQFQIDIANSPRTGFFWEQLLLQEIANLFVKDAHILDAFCATGWNSMMAAYGGAQKVIGLDYDEKSIQIAQENARINSLQNICTFLNANVFDVLKAKVNSSEKFDLILLDPPSFLKNKSKLESALKAYKELFLNSFKLLKHGGYLISACSSHLITEQQMLQLFQSAAHDCKKTITCLHIRNAPNDHPILIPLESSDYYRIYLLRVLEIQ